MKNIYPKTELARSNDVEISSLYNKVTTHIDNARSNIVRSIDNEMVNAYWCIGRDIVEEEQLGQDRAKYGAHLLQLLSKKLTIKYGRGFSLPTLKNARQFYLVYQNCPPISYAPRSQLDQKMLSPNLGWVHYRALMRISDANARSFYEIEAINKSWSGRELERQIDSLLFERLAKSKDKKGLMELALKGQILRTPVDAIKDPMVLEFLEIPESTKLSESKLEEALINNLQKFLLEIGAGFAFVGRQKRLTLDGDNFFPDLVFYCIPLKAYLIVDIKVHKLTHADLGQMQLYVNYYDQEIKDENDNPTIGLVLCTNKNNAMVKYTLGENSKQIFASKYQFKLPTVEQLEAELERELEQFMAFNKLDDFNNSNQK